MVTAGDPRPTRKESIWLACKGKACCHTPFVIPTGRDVWRIARILNTPLETFLLYFPTPVARRDAFTLDQTGREFRIALGKRPGGKKGAPPCIFLLRTRQGQHRCGLGELRPLVCRAFPADLIDGVLSLPGAERCTCRTWGLADVDIADEVDLVTRRQAASDEYCQVVADWNAMVAATPQPDFTFGDFCAYLLQAYDVIAGGEAAPPAGDQA